MNKYETVFILTPVLSDDQMKETVEKFKKVLTDNGGNIENEENWGLRKLAYPIENKNTGFYTLIEFEGEPTIVDRLETAYRRDEPIPHLPLGQVCCRVRYQASRRAQG